MPIGALRFTAFCAYLVAWIVLFAGIVASWAPRIQRQGVTLTDVKPSVVIGALLQLASILTITLRVSDGPLRPTPFELAAVALLAPFSAALFIWALLSAARNPEPNKLVTYGVFAWVRHPIYLAFLAMLLATGLLASAGLGLAVAVVLYLAGSELRIASEEEHLARTFRTEYKEYCLRTRWRYFPGLR